jgi:hypothetical protein
LEREHPIRFYEIRRKQSNHFHRNFQPEQVKSTLTIGANPVHARFWFQVGLNNTHGPSRIEKSGFAVTLETSLSAVN